MSVKIVKLGDDVPVEGSFEGTAFFGAIPGSINGDLKGPLTKVEGNTLGGLAFDLDQLSGMRGLAEVLTPDTIAWGLVVAPASTRIARVYTYFDIHGEEEQQALVGFADSNSKHVMVLVYFDRACHLTGSVEVAPHIGGTTKYRYDVTINNAGFHWLAYSPDRASDLTVVQQASESVKPILVVKIVSLETS